MASQLLTAASKCQEFESPIDQSRRRSAVSRLTTSTRMVSTAFWAMVLMVPGNNGIGQETTKFSGRQFWILRQLQRHSLQCELPSTFELFQRRSQASSRHC